MTVAVGSDTFVPIDPYSHDARASNRELRDQLDHWCGNLRQSNVVWQTMDELNDELTLRRKKMSYMAWRDLIGLCRQHPIAKLVHSDPFTGWSFRKPHGYPGDAELLDFIYHEESARARLFAASPIGQAIFARNRMVPACLAVRHRCELLAAKIDEVCFSKRHARILSVACGHLREAASSDAIASDHLETVVALDQDADSLANVARAYAGKRVDPRHVTVRQLLSGKFAKSNFDFIYAAGLYDYLEDRVAERLTRLLFDKLKPGGRLLIANFLDTAADAGYMEAYMDWFLILRSQHQFRKLVASVPEDQAMIREFVDASQTVTYIEIERC
jgi:extracellular factor (EF) 3-hydroxypalmitic acid methyl ester biosynthesis protein